MSCVSGRWSFLLFVTTFLIVFLSLMSSSLLRSLTGRVSCIWVARFQIGILMAAAAAAAAALSFSKPVVRDLYRSLYRTAREFDRRPELKVGLAFEISTSKWSKLSATEKSISLQLVQSIVLAVHLPFVTCLQIWSKFVVR